MDGDGTMLCLATKDECVGCTACVSVCPQKCLKIEYDWAGFSYPVLSEVKNCIECRMCENVCPIVKPLKKSRQNIQAYAAYSKDDYIRRESSSGGIFSELAKEILSNGGIVCGAAYDDNWSVNHIAISNIGDLWRLRGAKYSESRLDSVFCEINSYLKQGKQVLFSGTPCQVAGLKSYLGNVSGVILVDFICHGIPSPKAWENYIQIRKNRDKTIDDPIKINLRAKESGWSHYKYSYVFEYPDGTRYSVVNSDDQYMRLYCNDYISRKSCEKCNFKGVDRISDITIGDFWGIWDIMPEMDDNKGTSAVLVHSNEGQKLLAQISNRLILKKTTVEEISLQNTSLIESSLAPKEKDDILNKVCSGNYNEVNVLLQKKETAKRYKKYDLISKAIKVLKRIVLANG